LFGGPRNRRSALYDECQLLPKECFGGSSYPLMSSLVMEAINFSVLSRLDPFVELTPVIVSLMSLE